MELWRKCYLIAAIKLVKPAIRTGDAAQNCLTIACNEHRITSTAFVCRGTI